MDVFCSLKCCHGADVLLALGVSFDEGSTTLTTLTVVFVAPRSPSRHCRDGSAYGHATTAMRDNEHTPPQGRSIPHLDGLAHVAGWEPSNPHDISHMLAGLDLCYTDSPQYVITAG